MAARKWSAATRAKYEARVAAQLERAKERAKAKFEGRLGGRPAEDPANPRGRDVPPITTRVSASEREACESAARAEGKTLSAWARDALLLRAAAHGE